MSLASPQHRWTIRVYYEDTDFSGVVYHGAYLRFFERGRTEFLRLLGVDQSRMFAEGHAFAVRSMRLDFLKAARMDDCLDVVSRVAALGGASIDMRQTIVRGEQVLAEAAIRLGLVEDDRARRLPPDLAARLRPAVA